MKLHEIPVCEWLNGNSCWCRNQQTHLLGGPTLCYATKLRIVEVLSQVAQDGTANKKPRLRRLRTVSDGDRQSIPLGTWKVIGTWEANSWGNHPRGFRGMTGDGWVLFLDVAPSPIFWGAKSHSSYWSCLWSGNWWFWGTLILRKSAARSLNLPMANSNVL